MRDVLLDVPPESQFHKQVIRKSADGRAVAWHQLNGTLEN